MSKSRRARERGRQGGGNTNKKFGLNVHVYDMPTVALMVKSLFWLLFCALLKAWQRAREKS